MSGAPGSRLGPYEILAPLGAGGMGEVFRARDPKLNRDVAIKVLPAALANDAERVERFRREAQLLAALHHPNVAGIFGLEEADGVVALVMELVEGEDLAQRLGRGAIPVDEAAAIARQIAEGLEAAHERGIVHRDLKPANVKLARDGAVKILDFGLAKALEDDPAASDAGLTNSPTLSRQMTEAGMILGTAAYMSPEQARGKGVDKRADIWAFGVVLYEMLTGKRLFGGETVSDTLAAVLRQDVDLAALPAATPPNVRRLLARCLERDPKRRLRDIGEARLLLDERVESAALPAPAPPAKRALLPWVLAGGATLAAILLLAAWAPWRAAPAPAPLRLRVSLGTEAPIRAGQFGNLAISPDGATLAFTAGAEPAPPQLFVRRLDRLEAAVVPGSEAGAFQPFFSPDGSWIGFFAHGELRKAPVAGGSAVVLAPSKNARGATWTDRDAVVFTAQAGQSLATVPARGGAPTELGSRPPGVVTRRWPSALPGGRGVLLTEHTDITDFDAANIVLLSPDGREKTLVRGGYAGQWVPSGHLLYVRGGKLMALPFDLDRLEARGAAVPVLDGFVTDATTGGASCAVAANGTLAYVPGSAVGAEQPIDWIGREGSKKPLRAAPARWANPRFSPDGERLAFDLSDGRQRDLYAYEPGTDRLAQLTFDAANERAPVWSPDGSRIVFASDRGGAFNLYAIRADGTGGLERLSESPHDQIPRDWDPRALLYEERDGSAWSVVLLPLDGKGKPGAPRVLARVEANGSASPPPAPAFSPDGRFVAWRGDDGIYVGATEGDGRWKVPRAGTDTAGAGAGIFPRFARNGRELVFVNGSQIVVSRYTVAGSEFRAGTPEPWSPAPYQLLGVHDSEWALHPDGERVAALARREGTRAATNQVVLVLHFLDELKRLAPGGTR